MDGSTHIDTALRGYVDRICNLHQDRDAINGDIREVYGEVKEAGFNVTIVRGMVKEARMDAEARHSLYQLQEEYRGKLGLFADTPLGEATVEREAREAAPPEYPTHRWARTGDSSVEVERPAPFAEQPVHTPRPRGRPRKDAAGNGSRPMFDA